MFFNSKFDNDDTKSELTVICEEIDMYEDSPEDLVVEELLTAVYNPSLSYPILGTKKSISSFTGDFLREYKNSHYVPSNTVIAISGSFTESDIEYWKERFSDMPVKPENTYTPAIYSPAYLVKTKDIEQNHLFCAFPGMSASHKDRYALQILMNILGGGMSSRLFQSVREKNGLCYSIYTFGNLYMDCSIFGVYTALSSESENKAIGIILDELKTLKNCGVSQDELTRVCQQAKSNLLMSLESTSSRMTHLGKNELFLGKIPEPDQLIEIFDSITTEDIAEMANKYLDFEKLSFSAIGKVKSPEEYRKLIQANI